MCKTLIRRLLPVLFLTAGTLSLSAQATELRYDHRVAGDRALDIQLGPVFPEAFQEFNGTLHPANLTVGGTLGINLDVYISDSWTLGGGLRGKASSGPNGTTLFMVPMTFRAGYEFKLYPFSFPVGLGTGFSFTNYGTATSFDPMLMPTAGAYWNMSSSWSFGLDVAQWIIVQPFPSKPADNRIAYFTDLTLGAVYHF